MSIFWIDFIILVTSVQGRAALKVREKHVVCVNRAELLLQSSFRRATDDQRYMTKSSTDIGNGRIGQ